MRVRVVAAAAAVAGALVGAPHAGATPESDFCRSLAGAGVPGDCTTLTTLAQDVCAQKARGVDLNAVLQKLDAATNNETVSNFIIAGAQLYLCPEDVPGTA